MNHTPGPWFYVSRDEWSHAVVTQDGTLPDGTGNYWNIASINKNREPEHKANGRLIAAAPDLLEALQWAMKTGYLTYSQRIPKQNGQWCDKIDSIRSLIAKATGARS